MKYYYKTSEWTGVLFLPPKQKRRDDGGVYIKILNTPPSYASLKNKKIWLTIDGKSPSYYWYDFSKSSVQFDEDTFESIKRYNIHPERINGWNRISTLESLAGARPKNDVMVALSKVRVVKDDECGKALLIGREPVQISGNEFALVKFQKKVSGKSNKYIVKHYNKKKNDFSGIEEKIKYNSSGIVMTSESEITSLKNIENNCFNENGWYIYCSTDSKGNRVIEAIEPRDLLKVGEESEPIIRKKKISNILRKNLLSSNAKYSHEKYNLIFNKNKLTDDIWKIGEKAILFHVFGWRDGEGKNALKEGQRVDGHLGSGLVEIIKDPITEEKRFDISYRQLYCHNVEGIVSGVLKWHCYMGSLKRGVMFMIPFSDIIIKSSLLTKKLTNTGIKDFLNVLSFFTDRVAGKMRTGFGNGLSPVNSLTNCSQNTALAIYEAAYYLNNLKKTFPYYFEDIRDADCLNNYRDVKKFAKKITSFYSYNGKIPYFWKKHINNIKWISDDYKNNVLRDSLISYKSVLPVFHLKKIIKLFLKEAEAAYILKGHFIGGEIDNFDPVMPVFRYKKNKQL